MSFKELIEYVNQEQYVLGLVTGISTSIIWAGLLSIFRLIRDIKFVNAEERSLTGFWIVSFRTEGKSKENVEIYYFGRGRKSKYRNLVYNFRYQHYDDQIWVNKPLKGAGKVLYSANQIAGYYDSSICIGALLLKFREDYSAKYCPSFSGNYFEFTNGQILSSNQAGFNLYKIHLNFFEQLQFRVGIKCKKSFSEANSTFQTKQASIAKLG